MNAAERFMFVGGAIIMSAGPLSSLMLLPMAWDALIEGRLLRAIGLAFVAVVIGGAFGAIVSGIIETAYQSGMAAQRRISNQADSGSTHDPR